MKMSLKRIPMNTSRMHHVVLTKILIHWNPSKQKLFTAWLKQSELSLSEKTKFCQNKPPPAWLQLAQTLTVRVVICWTFRPLF